MGCATKNAKVITIALGCLQRLISLRAISLSALPAIIQTMNDCMAQSVDIQLKILQTLLSLITNFSTLHGRLLANVSVWSRIVGVLTDGVSRRCYSASNCTNQEQQSYRLPLQRLYDNSSCS